jgi:hypothetical protein
LAEADRPTQADIEALSERVKQLEKINEALIDRVERSSDVQGGAFSMFEAAIALESMVRDRTAALENALSSLNEANAMAAAHRDADAARVRRARLNPCPMDLHCLTPMTDCCCIMKPIWNLPALRAGSVLAHVWRNCGNGGAERVADRFTGVAGAMAGRPPVATCQGRPRAYSGTGRWALGPDQ